MLLEDLARMIPGIAGVTGVGLTAHRVHVRFGLAGVAIIERSSCPDSSGSYDLWWSASRTAVAVSGVFDVISGDAVLGTLAKLAADLGY